MTEDENIQRNKKRMETMKKNDEEINDLLVKMGLPMMETFEDQLIRLGERDSYMGKDSDPDTEEVL